MGRDHLRSCVQAALSTRMEVVGFTQSEFSIYSCRNVSHLGNMQESTGLFQWERQTCLHTGAVRTTEGLEQGQEHSKESKESVQRQTPCIMTV